MEHVPEQRKEEPSLEQSSSLSSGGSESLAKVLNPVRVMDATLEKYQREILPFIEKSDYRHTLPQNVIDAIVERGFQLHEALSDEEQQQPFGIPAELEKAVQLHGDFRRENESDESIVDHAYQSFIRLAPKYQDAAGRFANFIFQNGHTVRPDILIDGIAKLVAHPELTHYTKGHALHGFNYLYSFFGEHYDKALEQKLDFDNPDNFYETAQLLEFVRQLYTVSGQWSFSEDTAFPRIPKVLESVVSKNKGSYLLNARASEILGRMDLSEDSTWQADRDKLPFLIQQDVYAIAKEDGLYTARADAYGEITVLIDQIKEAEMQIQPSQEEIDVALARGESVVWFNPDRETIRQLDALYRTLYEKLDHKIGVTDLAFARGGRTPEEEQKLVEDLFDYQYLMTRMVRKRIEKDFNLDVTQLSLAEQYQFLNFIKLHDARSIQAVLRHADKYGMPYVKSFFAASYGEDYGGVIFSIAEHSPGAAESIFREYNRLNEQAKGLGEKLQTYVSQEELGLSELAETNFASQFAEAVMRRAKDMLNVAEVLGMYENTCVPFYGGKSAEVSSTEEVLESLRIYNNTLDKLTSFAGAEGGQYEFILEEYERGVPESFSFAVDDEHGKRTYMLVQLRDRGTVFENRNKEREYDGEARINFLFSDKPIGLDIKSQSRQDALSVRLDREGKIRDGMTVVENDPTRQDGELSFEIGSMLHENQGLPGSVVGRVVAVGNYLGMERQGRLAQEAPQYFHNRESFIREFGDADRFARIVSEASRLLRARYDVSRARSPASGL